MENSFPGGGGGCCRCQPRSPSRGHLQRRGGGKAGAVLHHRPSRLRGEAAGEGRGGAAPLLPAHHLSPATHTDTHTHTLSGDGGSSAAALSGETAEPRGPCLRRRGGRALWRSASTCLPGAAGAARLVEGDCLPLPLAGGRARCVSVAGAGYVGRRVPPQVSPGLGNFPGLRGAL